MRELAWSEPRRVLVFGASGYVGSHLVPKLAASGYRVRAAARHLEVLEGRHWRDVARVAADALKPETLADAMEGVDVAYYLVHSMAAGSHYAELDRRAADNFREAAQRAGVGRIIYLSALQPHDADSKHLRSRRETGERLRAGAVPVTEVRSGIVVGPGSAAFEVIRDLVYHLPIMVTPRWVRSRAQPIALDDLLAYLARLPRVRGDIDGILEVGGPEVLSYEQLMRQFGDMVGRQPKIIPIGLLSPRLSAYFLGLVTAVPANIASALIGGLKHDILADDARIRELIPLPLLTYRESVAAALEAEKQFAVAARWTEGAMMFRNYRPDYAYYAKQAASSAVSTASAAALWAQVAAIGGDDGYYYHTWLWRLRDALDRLVGGVGMRGGRRHPTELRVGDIVNSWRVVALKPEAHLTLMADFKLPGAGVLEFRIRPEGDAHRRVSVTAHFNAAGPLGFLYWYALVRVYRWLFRGMTRRIARRAEAMEAEQRTAFQSPDDS
jgi:uncharacterized protein YbjT (DUF2867 family)